MLCLTQDDLEKQKSVSILNVQHRKMIKKMITYIFMVNFFNKGAKAIQ